jgi:hypothetical protein
LAASFAEEFRSMASLFYVVLCGECFAQFYFGAACGGPLPQMCRYLFLGFDLIATGDAECESAGQNLRRRVC